MRAVTRIRWVFGGIRRLIFAALLPTASLLLVFAPTLHATLIEGPMAPVRPLYTQYKADVLTLEAALRGAPDTALSGLPGFAVLLLSCEGEGCIGPHDIRITGLAGPLRVDLSVERIQHWLAAAFPQGGWVPVVLPRSAEVVEISWGIPGHVIPARVTLPPPGRVTRVVRGGVQIAVEAERKPSSEHAWRVALAERARGDLLAGVAVLEAGLQEQDADPAHRLLLGDLYREAGLPDRARSVYRKLMTEAGDTALWARIGIAGIDLEQGDSQAVADALAPLDLPPNHPLASRVADLLVRAYLKMQKGQAAIALLPQAAGDPFVAVNRAMTYVAVGDTFSAILELKEAVRIANPSIPVEAYLTERVLLTLGTLYASQGKLDEALSAFSRMSREGPLGARQLYARGLAFYQNDDRVKAAAELSALAQKWPRTDTALEGTLLKADAYRQLNAPHQAITEYRQALEQLRDKEKILRALITEVEGSSFDEGFTGHIFSERWKEPDGAPGAKVGTRALFRMPGFSRVVEDFRQIGLTVHRLEKIGRRMAGSGQSRVAERLQKDIEHFGVFRTLYETAARQVVLDGLKDEVDRTVDLSVVASLGITQNILFQHGTGAVTRDLYFAE
ncbi:MAG: tetratricopeptide repeat protein [Leptospirillia bacterium]